MGDVKNLAQSLVFSSFCVRINFKMTSLDRGYFRFIPIEKNCLLNNSETHIINCVFYFRVQILVDLKAKLKLCLSKWKDNM